MDLCKPSEGTRQFLDFETKKDGGIEDWTLTWMSGETENHLILQLKVCETRWSPKPDEVMSVSPIVVSLELVGRALREPSPFPPCDGNTRFQQFWTFPNLESDPPDLYY